MVKISEIKESPFLQITDAKLVNNGLSSSFIEIKLNIKNAGETPATEVSCEMDYCNGSITNNFLEGNSDSRINIMSIGPDQEETVSIKSNRRNWRTFKIAKGRLTDRANIFGTIFYKDLVNKEVKKLDWCYFIKLNNEEALRTLDLSKCESDYFVSNYRHSRQ